MKVVFNWTTVSVLKRESHITATMLCWVNITNKRVVMIASNLVLKVILASTGRPGYLQPPTIGLITREDVTWSPKGKILSKVLNMFPAQKTVHCLKPIADLSKAGGGATVVSCLLRRIEVKKDGDDWKQVLSHIEHMLTGVFSINSLSGILAKMRYLHQINQEIKLLLLRN